MITITVNNSNSNAKILYVRLDEHAQRAIRLQQNYTIFGGLDEIDQQLCLQAFRLGKLCYWDKNLEKRVRANAPEPYSNVCLADDLIIQVQQYKPRTRTVAVEDLIFCPVENEGRGWRIFYPTGDSVFSPTLGLLTWPDWVHVGWQHKVPVCVSGSAIHLDPMINLDAQGQLTQAPLMARTRSIAESSVWERKQITPSQTKRK
jgi:hypothetical protein